MHLRFSSGWPLLVLLLAGCTDALGPARRPAPQAPRVDMSYLLEYGYRIEAQVAIPLPEVSYTRGYDGGTPWSRTGVVLEEGDVAVLEVKGTVDVRLHPDLVADACSWMIPPLERPNQCDLGADAVLETVGPDYYKDGWAAPVFRVAGSPLPLNFPFRGPGQIEMMRHGTWGPFWSRGILAPYHRYTGSQTVNIYVRRKPQPELTVTCLGDLGPNRVTRGKEISCTVGKKADAPGELTDIRWEFSGDDFKYPDADSGDEIPSDPIWRGEMAMSGTVTVKAKLGGSELSKSAAVTVEARTEFKQKHVSVDIRPGTLTAIPEERRPRNPPRNVTDLGRAVTNPGVSGYDPKTNLAEVLRTVRMIEDDGPNHGLAYLREVPMRPRAIVVIHPELTRGSAFYRAQAQSSNVVHGTPPCTQSRWDEYVKLVEAHEGLHAEPNSHVGVFEAALNPSAAQSVEHVVGRTNRLAEMADEWWRLLEPVTLRATRQSSDEVFHGTSGGGVRFGCEFNFDMQRK